jgi:hypothetical protein
MARKLFIVDPGNERLYSALRSALANERDVEIFYDRRTSSVAASWRGEERRSPSDVHDRIRADGFAVVRPDTQPPASNVRWA